MDKKPENCGVLALEITILRCIIIDVSCHPFVSGLSGEGGPGLTSPQVTKKGVLMNIGIDVDGTLIDTAAYLFEKGEVYFHRGPEDSETADVKKMFSLTQKELNRFGARFLLPYCIKSPIIEDAAEIIKRLKEEGNRILIITSRAFTSRQGLMGLLSRRILKNWLKKKAVPYDAISFCDNNSASKEAHCRMLNVDVMIDDNPDNLLTISQSRPVIAFPMPWNKDIGKEGIIRARDWQDVYDIIKQQEWLLPEPR